MSYNLFMSRYIFVYTLLNYAYQGSFYKIFKSFSFNYPLKGRI
jgi:hypothetical protein